MEGCAEWRNNLVPRGLASACTVPHLRPDLSGCLGLLVWRRTGFHADAKIAEGQEGSPQALARALPRAYGRQRPLKVGPSCSLTTSSSPSSPSNATLTRGGPSRRTA
ncbi:hypothetical protein N8I77_000290 [Diaporthe amygdali]|uniref:Uncharacterized protein n=1 Tax=Phomopsis amygdali TaxID=1214568 RepID=A0AAD9SPP9_PHOAM|nr:hypothetical protein N8I77_000290 [Diaporthe amygdali]